MASQGQIHILWTQEVVDEAKRSLISRFPEDTVKLRLMFDRIMSHFYDNEVRGFEKLIGTLGCKDKDDEHVLAGAIQGKADVLLTYNTRDFPLQVTHNLAVMHPDEFLSSWLEANPEIGVLIVSKWLQRFENPPLSAKAAADLFDKIDCPMLASFIRRRAKVTDAQIHRLRGSGSR